VKATTPDPDVLTQMLTRLKLTAIRDQLDSLLDTATRRKLTLLDTVKLLCEAEVARKDERRIQMASSIASACFPAPALIRAFAMRQMTCGAMSPPDACSATPTYSAASCIRP